MLQNDTSLSNQLIERKITDFLRRGYFAVRSVTSSQHNLMNGANRADELGTATWRAAEQHHHTLPRSALRFKGQMGVNWLNSQKTTTQRKIKTIISVFSYIKVLFYAYSIF